MLEITKTQSAKPRHDHNAIPLNPDALTAALRAQAKKSYLSLRFEKQLEPLFRHYMAETGRETRIILFLIFALMTATLPWTATHLMGQPPLVARYSDPLMYAQTPLMLLGAYIAWRWPVSSFLDWYCITLYLCCIAAELAERSIGAAYGFEVPLLWVALATTALLVAMRIRFWHLLPWVLLVCLATVINEQLFVASNATDYYDASTLVQLILVACVGGYSLEYFMRKTWINQRLLHYVSNHDGLTGVLNRKALSQAMQRVVAHARRERWQLAVAMIDVDYFKNYNDAYGHRAGDRALQSVATALNQAARRPQDVCGRYGGEEFVLVWSGSQSEDLTRLAETARAAVEQIHLRHDQSKVSDSVTVSIGLYCIDTHHVPAIAHAIHRSPEKTTAELLAAADKLLYKAKIRGRNRVVSETGS